MGEADEVDEGDYGEGDSDVLGEVLLRLFLWGWGLTHLG
jgi:hypothetical protein